MNLEVFQYLVVKNASPNPTLVKQKQNSYFERFDIFEYLLKLHDAVEFFIDELTEKYVACVNL